MKLQSKCLYNLSTNDLKLFREYYILLPNKLEKNRINNFEKKYINRDITKLPLSKEEIQFIYSLVLLINIAKFVNSF